MQELIGRTLGQYKIIEQIGQGGMAAVFKARQQGLERWVAVKVLPPDYAADPEFSRRFQREAQAIAQLEHPHILPVYDFGQQGPYTYLVMRYIEHSRTLLDVMRQEIPFKKALQYLEQVAAALDHAHGRGIIHRDVKPANILLSQDWVFLADFGLARLLSSAEITWTGIGSGSPAYMSPEQGAGQRLDARTDVYALGVIVYQMFTGHIPHLADSTQAMIYRRNHQPPPSLRDIRPDIPLPVEQVIQVALSPDPARRYQSAGSFIGTLHRVIWETGASNLQTVPRAAPQPVPISPSPPPAEVVLTPAPAAGRPGGLYWLLGGLAVLVAVTVLAAGLVWLALRSPPGDGAPLPLVTPTAVAGGALDEIFWDNFNSVGLDPQKWGFSVGSGHIQVYGGELRLTSSGQTFPLVYPRENPFPAEGDFRLSVALRYLDAAQRGSGIRLNSWPLTGHIDQAGTSFSEGRIIEIWQDQENWRISVGEQNLIVYNLPAPALEGHEITIDYRDQIYHILLDGREVYASDPTPIRPGGLWLGNPLPAATDGNWSGLQVSRIAVSAQPPGVPAAGPVSTASPTPTPTTETAPTATPTPQVCQLGPGPTFDGLWQVHRQELGCPVGDQQTLSTIAEESFQGGHTFWIQDTEQVFIVYDRSKETGEELFEGRWQPANPDWKWDGSNPEGIGLSPPPGLVEPQRGFGWLWRTHLGGPEGPLGWALDKEYGFDNTGQAQLFEHGIMFKGSFPRIYILLRNGRFFAG